MDIDLRENIENEFEDIVELLYQQKIGEAYTKLVSVLPRFEELLNACDEQMQGELMQVLQSALEAMEQQDTTLLADILQYEILERMKDA